MYYYDLSTFMINKDGSFSTNICLIMAFPELFPMSNKKVKWLKRCLSIPVESKRAENILEPADEGS